MANKETSVKKTETKKKSSTKKNTISKESKKEVKITEQQFPSIVEKTQDSSTIEEVNLEKFKNEKGEYDLTKASEEEVKSVYKQLESDDEIHIVKTQVINGDPAVLSPVESTKEEEVEETENGEPIVVEKKENKITKRKSQTFGYFWNGQTIDF